ncbi:hypothetical protein [Parabacteroides johnsonii]
MERLKAEEARRIANDHSVEIQQQLEVICKQIEQVAKEGRFQIDIHSDISDTGLISPIMEQLVILGYDVTSFSLKDLSLKIKW